MTLLPIRTPLEVALDEGLRPGGNIAAALEKLGDYPIQSAVDAQVVCEAFQRLCERCLAAPIIPAEQMALWTAVLGLFQDVATPETLEIVAAQGLPAAIGAFDALYVRPERPHEFLLLALKVFAMFNDRAGLERLVQAAKDGYAANDLLWSVVFQQIEADHPARHRLCAELRSPLPVGLIGLAYLNFVNRLAIAGELLEHPFRTAEGFDRLKAWLTEPETDPESHAKVVATAIPFTGDRAERELLPLAQNHPAATVQLEAAWAAARLRKPAGIDRLAAFAGDPRYSSIAADYLKELGQAARIPAATQSRSFQAMAEMCQWLAHPMEFGRPPDVIELVDQRDIHWPPTNDRRPLWLFRFGYHVHDGDEASPMEFKLGLVGSITFSLWIPAEIPADDAYALHCCWELEVMRDPRAPKPRSVEAGRALLAEENK